MKKHLMYVLMVFSPFCFSQVGINTETPDTSSNLTVSPVDKNDHYKGTLLNPMTTDQINSIEQPAKGLLAYDLDRKCLKINIGIPEAPDWKCIRTKNE